MNSEETSLIKSYYSRGKFIITGEYLVLSGADAFALPLKYGQSLKIYKSITCKNILTWQSFIGQNQWFDAVFDRSNFEILQTSDSQVAETLSLILKKVRVLNPLFLTQKFDFKAVAILDFDITWGLGSSSSLISNIAWWADIDPYSLLNLTFGGSGYDIACARSSSPLIYNIQRKDNLTYVNFSPDFQSSIFFAYSGKKQKSSAETDKFSKITIPKEAVNKISQISRDIPNSSSIYEFINLLMANDKIISELIKKEPVFYLEFSDFNGYIKNMGAWGGDFFLVASPESPDYIKSYLFDKGFKIFFSFSEIVF